MSRVHLASRTAFMLVLASVVLSAVPSVMAQSRPETSPVVPPSPFRAPANLSEVLSQHYRVSDAPAMATTLELDDDQIEQIRSRLGQHALEHREAEQAFQRELTDVRQSGARMRQARAMQDQMLRDIEALDRAFESAGDQSEIARQRYERERDRIRATAEAATARLGAGVFGPESREAETQRIAQLMSSWRETMDIRQAGLRGDMQALLTEEQRERWDTVERDISIDRRRVRGKLGPEALDLQRILSSLKLTLTSEIQAEYDAYLTSIEALMRDRDEAIGRGFDQAWRATWSEAQAAAAIDDIMVRRQRIADATRSMAQVIAGSLSVEDGVRFRRAFDAASYPSIFRRTAAERQFTAALRFEDLGADTVLLIESMREAWLVDLDQLNDTLKVTLDERQPLLLAASLRRRWGMTEDEDLAVAATEIQELMKQRSVRGTAYIARLRATLTPDQAARLP
ncbi:MAG: hypothetical protein AAF432_06735 [Planctomycetota bacterium]